MRLVIAASFLLLAVPPAVAGGPRVSIDVKDRTLADAAAEIGRAAGVTIEVSDSLKDGKITGEFSETPLSDALARILYPAGFTFRLQNEAVVVDRPE